MQRKLAARQGIRPRSMPYIIYSQNRRDVATSELALLLAVAKDYGLSVGSRQRRNLFAHWDMLQFDEEVREQMQRKLAMALDNSHAMVAAFTNYDVYQPSESEQLQNDLIGTTQSIVQSGQAAAEPSEQQPGHISRHESASNLSWDWLLPASEGRLSRKRSLIGFVRATGDRALACTIYDLAVHPEFRGYGIGSKLLKVLTQQLYNKEMYDIGSVVPLELEPLLRRCNFDDDREASTTMTFTQHHQWVDEGLVPTGLWPGQEWLLQPQQAGHKQRHGTDSKRSRVYKGSDNSRGQAQPGQQQGIAAYSQVMCAEHETETRSGVTWPADILQHAPCPATRAAQESESLQQLLSRKLHQQLG